MMGTKKLSTIYQELREAMAAEKENPILSLDREIRKLKRNPKSGQKDLQSLLLVRNALARAVAAKPKKGASRPRPKTARKAI